MLCIFFILLAQAHVRMFYDPGQTGAQNRRIRNANGNGDGGFSTNGPCGGAATWGGTGAAQMSTANPGDTVVLKIQYNGGHKSAQNEFAVRFKCGVRGSGPTQDEMKSQTDLPAGTCSVLTCPVANQYPCGAPEGNSFTPGYTFSCTIPNSAAGQDCTYSVLDQRDWGGCVDLRVSDTTAAPDATSTMPSNTSPMTISTLDPNPQPAGNFPSQFAQSYKYYNDDVFTESPKYSGCCCKMDEGTNV